MLTRRIWKYRADVEPEVREERMRLRASEAGCRRTRKLSVGFDVVKLPRSFDTGLVAVFRDVPRWTHTPSI